MRSFRVSLAIQMATGVLALFAAVSVASVLALRSLLYRELDATLLHLAEVEAQAGAAATGSAFEFHEGVLLAQRDGAANELTRYAQLWTSDGRPLVRSRNLGVPLDLPAATLAAARSGRIAWATHSWQGHSLRSVVYPLELVGAAHGVHLLQVAAPTEPTRRTLSSFSALVALLAAIGAAGAYLVGWRIAGVALRPTREITDQAEAIEAGTLSERITAHADVDEFRRLTTVLNAMLNRLDRAFQIQQRFTADASHELRAPLTALRGDIEVTLRRPRSAEQYEATLHRCREEVLRLAALTNDLLILARSDAGVLMDQRYEVDLRALLDRIVERYRPLAAARRMTFVIEGTDGIVLGDPALLDRVVANLVDNGVKYGAPGGSIRIEVVAGSEVSLTVTDDGPGIAGSDTEHLFTRFFRSDPARPRAEGAGLGLAIAQAGAVAHGGRVEFTGNRPGASFRLTLPVAPSRPGERQDPVTTSLRQMPLITPGLERQGD